MSNQVPLSQKHLLVGIKPNRKFLAASKNVKNVSRLGARSALLGPETSAFG